MLETFWAKPEKGLYGKGFLEDLERTFFKGLTSGLLLVNY